ncbi:sulfatase-like hydrolase/transferase [Candidatus Saccharibacteria bacterium]|nr:sulfatase-like hydrolase/transferase [Candidatus Saccharibacteria bacterium]
MPKQDIQNNAGKSGEKAPNEKALRTRVRKRFMNTRTKQVVIKCLILFAAAVFLTWLLEYRYFLNSAPDAFQFMFDRTLVFIYSAVIMFFIVLLIYGLVRRPFLAVSITTSLVLIIGYINISKFNFRWTPLFPEDFQLSSQAGTLTKFVDAADVVRLIVAVILCVTLGVLLDWLTAKWLKHVNVSSNVWWKRYRVISRIAIIAVAVAGFMVTTDFARNHPHEREIKLAFLDSTFIDWDQVRNYEDNGFLLGFLYNLNQLEITSPDGYSADKLTEIKRELEIKREGAKVSRSSLKEVDANIVFILNESFYDPTRLSGDVYRIEGGDVTPNLHRLQENILSGTMYSIDYGGGTANIEYEVLTGLTNYWLKTVPYTNLLPKQKAIPSVAQFAKDSGMGTATIHPFGGGMYKRENVLPKMGFDTMIFENDFTHREKYGRSEYINDGETYRQLLDYLAEKDDKQFVSVITMQNHAPYDADLYDEKDFTVTAGSNGEALAEDEKRSIETYLASLHKSDEFLETLISGVNALDEKTIVLFYGDHSPGVFPQVVTNDDKNISDSVRKTPYFIYANFELDAEKVTAVLDAEGRLPETTPNCLANTLLNILDTKKPLNFYLLDEVCQTEPILTDVYFGSKAPFVTTALSEYNLLTYDEVTGRQYAGAL